MMTQLPPLTLSIETAIRQWVTEAHTATGYREPLVGYAADDDPRHSFDPVPLISRWSHRSVTVIVGLGSLGLHPRVISDAGCEGRFGSLVLDAHLPIAQTPSRERLPVLPRRELPRVYGALSCGRPEPLGPLDKQRCYQRLLTVPRQHQVLALADVCGKCAIGPCSLTSAVQPGTMPA